MAGDERRSLGADPINQLQIESLGSLRRVILIVIMWCLYHNGNSIVSTIYIYAAQCLAYFIFLKFKHLDRSAHAPMSPARPPITTAPTSGAFDELIIRPTEPAQSGALTWYESTRQMMSRPPYPSRLACQLPHINPV